MLQQILRDMWVDPEILAELDENQKQVLFCKMREEQVRRWKDWDSQLSIIETDRPGNKRKVGFLLGADGEPWVWVMGEHEDDLTIEDILENEAKEAARNLAIQEAQQLRLSVEAELGALLEENKKLNEDNIITKEEILIKQSQDEDIYCSVDEIRLRQPQINNKTESNNINKNNNQNNLNSINNNINLTSAKRDALQEISLNKPKKNVLQKVALWEKKVMEERTSEIYQTIQKKKQEANKEAEEMDSKQELMWKEQQRKAKEAELAKREIARRAREEHRRSVIESDPPAIPPRAPTSNLSTASPLRNEAMPLSSSKPPSKDAIMEWFKSSQFTRKAGLEPNGNEVAPWFHGLISRSEAETLLNDQPVGSFLVRVSERIWGYAISYKDIDRCKHYLIDASNGHYQFLGNNQISHDTLYDLIHYHGAKPITALGGELLGRPCHRNEPMPAIFQGLIRAR